MEEIKQNIKNDFEEKIKSIEENEKKINNLKKNILYTFSILIFAFVLCGTILSYKNYVQAKKNIENKNNHVIEISTKG